jgi:glucose dehydrogenase
VALDVDTGKLKWYYQVIPQDEWDGDQIPTPTITDLRVGGKNTRVAILPTTTGFVTVFDMQTGKFLNGWQMMPETSVHKGFTPDGKSIIDDSFRYQNSGDSKLLCAFRWVNWEPAAYSPATGLYYRPNVYDCEDLINKAIPADWKPGQNPLNFEFKAQPDRFSRLGALSAIDPKTGKVAWEFSYGYGNNAGPVATAGGLVFSGFMDRVFRAFDAQTGQILWQQVMPAYMTTSPITYTVNGKQYVAITVGGTTPGSAVARQTNQPASVDGEATVFVFALP